MPQNSTLQLNFSCSNKKMLQKINKFPSIMHREWHFQWVSQKGCDAQWKQKDGGVTGRREETRETSLISANSSMPGLGNAHRQTWARQDWHAKSLWHMLARWHPVCSGLARAHKHTCASLPPYPVERGEGQRGGSGREQLWVHVLQIINSSTSGWRGERGMGVKCTAEKEMDRWGEEPNDQTKKAFKVSSSCNLCGGTSTPGPHHTRKDGIKKSK